MGQNTSTSHPIGRLIAGIVVFAAVFSCIFAYLALRPQKEKDCLFVSLNMLDGSPLHQRHLTHRPPPQVQHAHQRPPLHQHLHRHLYP